MIVKPAFLRQATTLEARFTLFVAMLLTILGVLTAVLVLDANRRQSIQEMRSVTSDIGHVAAARMAAKSKRIVAELFAAFAADTRLLPPEFQRRSESDGVRAIADYIAGMTDRYAIAEHRRLFAIESI